MCFILAYTSAFGVVFFSTLAFHLRKPVFVMETIYSGVVFFLTLAFHLQNTNCVSRRIPMTVIMDHDLRRRGQDVVKEGLYMISLMLTQAISIKFLETLVCGYLGRWMATMVGWKLFVATSLSLGQVYFIAVWLVFYFAICSNV
ncbi:hypothetical protein MUK42_26306 [Musa troglodytarum]|uniref:Uncharacterized protein n=1 Tax=Musa troglodytarum TaxID=320322 RepID=A0A9E7JL84_9LILI|nr:hypothetical protein MUK42_26306 [Musa troglodytarum]